MLDDITVQSFSAEERSTWGTVDKRVKAGLVLLEHLDTGRAATAEASVLHQVKVLALGLALDGFYLGATNAGADLGSADDGQGGGDGGQSDEEDQQGTHLERE